MIPQDGEKVTADGKELAWHAVDTKNYNVNLYHFAHALDKPTSDVLFWAVTVVNSPQRDQRCTAGDWLQRGVRVVGERSGSDRDLRRSPDRDG